MPVQDSSPRPVIHARVLRNILNATDIGASHRSSLLAREGLTTRDLEGLDVHVPLVGYMRILDRLAGDLGDPMLGLTLSDRMGPELLGAIGYIFMLSPSLDAAITAFSESVFSIQGVTSLKYAAARHPIVTYSIFDDAMRPRRQDVEFSIGYVHRLIKLYLRENYAPMEVYFEHPRPGPQLRYDWLFGCPVYFEQSTNALVLHEAAVLRRAPDHDPHLIAMLRHYIQLARHEGAERNSMTNDVDQMLSGLIDARNPSVHVVATRLGLSEETLRRRLKREGTSFREILRRKRIAMARRHLCETNLSVLQIAQRAGYAETASFTRAFVLETGMTPSQFRQRG